MQQLSIRGYTLSPVRERTLFHPGRSCHIMLNNQEIGICGELHPAVLRNFDIDLSRVCVAELDLSPIPQARALPPVVVATAAGARRGAVPDDDVAPRLEAAALPPLPPGPLIAALPPVDIALRRASASCRVLLDWFVPACAIATCDMMIPAFDLMIDRRYSLKTTC